VMENVGRIEQAQAVHAETVRHHRATEASAAEARSESGRHNRAIEAASAAAAAAKAGTPGSVDPKKVIAFGKDFEKADIPKTSAVLGDVERVLLKPGIAEKLTGIGSLQPDAITDPDIREARQALDKLFNIELKNRSGAAVTEQELKRLKDEYGRGVFKTPDQIIGAARKARMIVEAHAQALAAGYGPEVLQAYNDNLVKIGGRPVIQVSAAPAAPAGGPKKITGDADYNALPAGTEFMGPDGVLRRKP
jgi:hypothetical protein